MQLAEILVSSCQQCVCNEHCQILQSSIMQTFSLVPRPLPRFLRVTLKTWERPGDEASKHY